MVVAGAAARIDSNRAGEVPGPAVGKVVAVDRGHHDMRKPELRHRLGDPLRLAFVQRIGQAGAHVAEGAGAGAGLAHDHESRVALRPALANIGAVRLLADGRELEAAHQRARFRVDRGAGRLDADPGRLAGDRLVRPMRLLRMSRAGLGLGQTVDELGHSRLSRSRSDGGQTRRKPNAPFSAPLPDARTAPARGSAG